MGLKRVEQLPCQHDFYLYLVAEIIPSYLSDDIFVVNLHFCSPLSLSVERDEHPTGKKINRIFDICRKETEKRDAKTIPVWKTGNDAANK